jgi:serine/threonine-protein kinase
MMQNVAPGAPESTQTGKYRVLLELGQGGTAHVYLAVAEGLVGFNKLVVLKAMKASLGGDPELRRMFLNEARLSARLSHPNIVQVNEVMEHDGLPIIVMEYLEGKPLSDLRNRAGDKLRLALHLRIISEALSGLHYSHDLTDYDGSPLDVVHRDFTPHNVFVTFEGQVKVLDFGIAKLSGSLVETQTGVIKGKLRYMPPEQFTGERIDRRADVFAAGVMIWEAAAGSRMWGDLSEAVVMNRVLNGEIPSPRSVAPDVSPEIERICMKALSYDRADRYATIAELQSDLEAFLSGLSALVTTREIGRFVTDHFEDSRVQTRRVIEQQLSNASLSAVKARGALSFTPSAMSNTRSTYTSSTIFTPEEQPPPSRARNIALWVGGLAIAIGAVTLWRVNASQQALPAPDPKTAVASVATPSEAARSGASSEASNSPAPAQPAPVMLRVTAFPLSAEISLDGKPLPGNPYAGPVPVDRMEHVVEARAEGYSTESKTTTFGNDIDLVLTLKQEPGAKASSYVRRAPARATPARDSPPEKPAIADRPSSSSAGGVDCNPPYYLDQRGVKKFKPECL